MSSKANIWSVPSPDQEPSLTLRDWLILECANGKRYLVGYCVERLEGRASTAIAEFDATKMRVRTASGRLYQLEGAPGFDADAIYVWRGYARVNGYVFARDVTAEYWPGWSGRGPITDNMRAAIIAALGSLDG